MSGKNTIVVGVDGSFESATALDWAIAEAARRGGGVQIVHLAWMPVVAAFGDLSMLAPPDSLLDYGKQVLHLARERAAERDPAVHVETTLLVRRPDEGLIEAAADAGLIVVGASGLSGWGGRTVGSVTSRVAASAHCPTVVVPSGAVPTEGPVVVGVDGSAHGDAALALAMSEAALRGSELIAVHAFGVPLAPMAMADPDTSANVVAHERQRAMDVADQAVARARAAVPAEVEVTTRVERGGAADLLLTAGQDAALLVVGSRGYGRLRGLFLGSVSQAVLHQASRPVAVVHTPDPDTGV